MSNMGYCRFENTSHDLSDCEEHIADKLDDYETRGRLSIVMSCANILQKLGFTVAGPDGEEFSEAGVEKAIESVCGEGSEDETDD